MASRGIHRLLSQTRIRRCTSLSQTRLSPDCIGKLILDFGMPWNNHRYATASELTVLCSSDFPESSPDKLADKVFPLSHLVSPNILHHVMFLYEIDRLCSMLVFCQTIDVGSACFIDNCPTLFYQRLEDFAHAGLTLFDIGGEPPHTQWPAPYKSTHYLVLN